MTDTMTSTEPASSGTPSDPFLVVEDLSVSFPTEDGLVSAVVKRRLTALLTQRYPETGLVEGRPEGAGGAADPPVGAARTGTGGVAGGSVG